jgi:hypothetical protein
MSVNIYPGNAGNYPTAIHKVETGDTTPGATWQVPLSELADRTAYLEDRRDRVYIFGPGTSALNLTSHTKLFGVEITIVGGGQSGGRSSAVAHGYGGAAGDYNRIYIPYVWDNAFTPADDISAGVLPKNFSITVGAGGSGSGGGNLWGNRGAASYVTDVTFSRTILIAQGGGFVDLDVTNYGTGYVPPPSQGATWIANAYNDYLAGGTKLPEHVRKHGTGYGYAQHGMMPGGLRGQLISGGDATNRGGYPGYGAGAGGGGGVATAGAGGGSALDGTGGHGGYGFFTTSVESVGTIAATVANGGGGADGVAIVRVMYR